MIVVMTSLHRIVPLCLLAAAACASPAPPVPDPHSTLAPALSAPKPSPPPTASAPAPGIDSSTHTGSPTAASTALRDLAQTYWTNALAADPLEATLLGYPGYVDQMPDESPDAIERYDAQIKELKTQVLARAPESELSQPERVTRGLLLAEIDNELALSTCHFEEWSVDPRDGPQVSWLDLATLQSVASPKDAAALLQRWHAMPKALQQIADNLRRGLAAGKTSAHSEVARVSRELDELLAKPSPQWALVSVADRATGSAWTDAERARFRSDLTSVVEREIRPAFVSYRQLIKTQILPRSRGDARVGMLNLPGGTACYAILAQEHTSLSIDPIQVHQRGLNELSRIQREMSELGPSALGSADFKQIQKRMRSKDPSLFFSTREEVEAAARAALSRASAAMPRFLEHVPKTACVVKAIEPHAEKDSPAAYYREAALDGSRAGTYYVNTYAPETRPRFEAEALAFHESIPGHHVQIALAQELTNVPDFQRNLGVSAFVEGWGLYAEGLADELGLYSSPQARMGRLGMEAWRAARLVVDTGIHARGWSRQKAVQFLLDNTTDPPNDIENEVDRYIGWPGQALAYKLGELEILKLRALAQQRLGARFDLRRFHDAVLSQGALTLPLLDRAVERWLDAETASAAQPSPSARAAK